MPTSRSIIESLLFVAEGPLSVEQLQRVLPETDKKEIKAALAAIKDDFDSRQGGFFLQEVAGGYQFRTPAGHKEWIREMFHPGGIRLSRAALETLAIIAYRQPVMRSEIEHIRGVNSGGTIRLLLERKLIRIL
ncbi:MAG TPA: SMC-Scp complex subunit ScpB, partial [Desulfosalsimonadaceae bacterium]|nr:SMC-Scp complex subunit ScpB [Desulfosalsimonadaceae bacterium]